MILNEYKTEIDIEEKTVFASALDGAFHRTAIIRSADDDISKKVKTDCIFLKSNVLMKDECNETVGTFHVIQCISQDIDVNEQFIRVCKYLFEKLDEPVSTSFIIGIFQDMQTLFETSADPAVDQLRIGVFGEMAFLKYLHENGRKDVADKWHSDFYSKHDIELDEKNRIEIKTASGESRTHSFRHNQLVREGVNVFVASLLVEKSDTGTSLRNLLLEMQNLLENQKQIMEIEKLMRRCQLSEHDEGIRCNLEYIYSEIRIFRAEDIPHIREDIPSGITNLSYTVDLGYANDIVQLCEIP